MDKEGVRRLTPDTGMSAWSFCSMWTDEQQYVRKIYLHFDLLLWPKCWRDVDIEEAVLNS